MKTWNGKTTEAQQKWWLVDATDQTLGRLATQIAQIIRGKNKATFTPNADMGDYVVVVNAEKVKLSGNKLEQKKYYRHSRFFGGIKEFTAEQMKSRDPVYMLEEAVNGMLPKTKLGRRLQLKLKAYKGPEHPHKAQNPEVLKTN